MIKSEEDIDNAYVVEGDTENILDEVIILKFDSWFGGELNNE